MRLIWYPSDSRSTRKDTLNSAENPGGHNPHSLLDRLGNSGDGRCRSGIPEERPEERLHHDISRPRRGGRKATPAQAVTPSGPAAEELDLGQGDSAVLPRAVRRVDGESGPYGVRAAQVEGLLARLVPKPDGPARAFAVL